MKSFCRRLWNNKRGNSLLIAAGAMPMVVGAAGLASDTIQWALWKRQLQRAADSASIAGVYAKLANEDVTTQVSNDVTKNNRTGISLHSGPTIGYPANGTNYDNAVSVQLQVQRALSFSSLFITAAPIITANSTAAAVGTGDYCVVSLENTTTTGITAGGNANVNLGCGMITDSTSMTAAVAFGSSSVTASPIAAVGGLSASSNWATGTTLLPFTIAETDPFALVAAPAIPASCNGSISDSPNANTSPVAGCYTSMNVKGNMTLSGTYIITGNVDVSAQAKLSCASCTIILTNSNPSSTGSVTINGGAQLNLAAQTTGPYAGIMFYQNRGATSGGTNKINGNSSSTFQGAVYFPNQNVVFTGTSGVTYNCIELVSRTVTFMGNSSITNNCPANSGAGAFKGHHIRLVA